jgi:hypothetical protein
VHQVLVELTGMPVFQIVLIPKAYLDEQMLKLYYMLTVGTKRIKLFIMERKNL